MKPKNWPTYGVEVESVNNACVLCENEYKADVLTPQPPVREKKKNRKRV